MSENRAIILASIWTIVILVLVGIPGNSLPKTSGWVDLLQPDKLIHIGMFTPFTLFWLSVFIHKKHSINKSILIVGAFGIIYAFLTEVLQHYVFIGRNANLPDAIADTFGVVIGLVLCKKLYSNMAVK